jgi:transcriptional regulator with XRE-family HTH domain
VRPSILHPDSETSAAAHKLKPIVARTPEELAGALGLYRVAAKEWQVQHALLGRLKEIARRRKFTHAEIAKRAGTSRTRVTAILNDDIEHVSSDLLIRILASLGYRVKISVVRSDTAGYLARQRGSDPEKGSLRTRGRLFRKTATQPAVPAPALAEPEAARRCSRERPAGSRVFSKVIGTPLASFGISRFRHVKLAQLPPIPRTLSTL